MLERLQYILTSFDNIFLFLEKFATDLQKLEEGWKKS